MQHVIAALTKLAYQGAEEEAESAFSSWVRAHPGFSYQHEDSEYVITDGDSVTAVVTYADGYYHCSVALTTQGGKEVQPECKVESAYTVMHFLSLLIESYW